MPPKYDKINKNFVYPNDALSFGYQSPRECKFTFPIIDSYPFEIYNNLPRSSCNSDVPLKERIYHTSPCETLSSPPCSLGRLPYGFTPAPSPSTPFHSSVSSVLEGVLGVKVSVIICQPGHNPRDKGWQSDGLLLAATLYSAYGDSGSR